MSILSGEQIGENWPIIKASLKMSAAPTADINEKKLTRILKSLLSGMALCFMTGNKRRPRTVIIVTIGIEAISGTKNMMIYSAHGFEKEKSEEYVRLLQEVSGYARAQKCDNIICYVWNDKMKELLKKYGARCDYTLAVYPLN